MIASGPACAIAPHARRCEFAPGLAKMGAPPASSTSSGIQWPALIGGSVHSRTSVRGLLGAPAVLARNAEMRDSRRATRLRAVVE
ncbi:MAG TPA: hypothetical protein VNU22_11180 [Candidatus Acidoferrum sp.]|nr:hypothetical protein [Candidatus Acidoferrum sp.]